MGNWLFYSSSSDGDILKDLCRELTTYPIDPTFVQLAPTSVIEPLGKLVRQLSPLSDSSCCYMIAEANLEIKNVRYVVQLLQTAICRNGIEMDTFYSEQYKELTMAWYIREGYYLGSIGVFVDNPSPELVRDVLQHKM